MPIRLIATDMDGTLLNSRKELPPDFIDWVKSHPEIKILIASGRQYFTLEKDFLPIRDMLTFVADNGSLVCSHGEIIYKNIMSYDDVKQVIDVSLNIPQAIPILCGVRSAYIASKDEEFNANAALYYSRITHIDDILDGAKQDEIVKLTFFFKHFAAEANFAPFQSLPAHICPLVTAPSWIDVANSSASKGKAIEAVQKAFGIAPCESMAFGDYLNDLSMFDFCEESYAMENAHDLLKAKAKHLTTSNDQDGVMKILRTL